MCYDIILLRFAKSAINNIQYFITAISEKDFFRRNPFNVAKGLSHSGLGRVGIPVNPIIKGVFIGVKKHLSFADEFIPGRRIGFQIANVLSQ